VESNRLTGCEHRDEFLQEMGFSALEIARVAAMRGRSRGQGSRVDIFALPKLFSRYNSFHKKCYVEVFGDAAAEAIFGFGPWLGKARRGDK
jgi:hypothetical protein